MSSIFFLTSPLRNPPPRGRSCSASYRFSDRFCATTKREIASLEGLARFIEFFCEYMATVLIVDCLVTGCIGYLHLPGCFKAGRNHDPFAGVLPCEQCGKIFGRKHHLKRHILTHTRPQLHLTCEQCGKALTQKCYDRGHVGSKEFKCRFCPKSYTRRYRIVSALHTSFQF